MKNKLFKISCFVILTLHIGEVGAQIRDYFSLEVSTGILDFGSKSLKNNNNNSEKRFSSVNTLQLNIHAGKYIDIHTSWGLGYRNSLGNYYAQYESSYFRRNTFGLALKPLRLWKGYKKNQLLDMDFSFSYLFDKVEINRELTRRELLASIQYMPGFYYATSPKLRVFYKPSLNQELGQDYRTFYQHSIGLRANF
jgi:hypothetical protein